MLVGRKNNKNSNSFFLDLENNLNVKIQYYTPLHSSYTLYEDAVLHVCKVGVEVTALRVTYWRRRFKGCKNSKITVTTVLVDCSPMNPKIIPMMMLEEFTEKSMNQRCDIEVEIGPHRLHIKGIFFI